MCLNYIKIVLQYVCSNLICSNILNLTVVCHSFWLLCSIFPWMNYMQLNFLFSCWQTFRLFPVFHSYKLWTGLLQEFVSYCIQNWKYSAKLKGMCIFNFVNVIVKLFSKMVIIYFCISIFSLILCMVTLFNFCHLIQYEMITSLNLHFPDYFWRSFFSK